MSMTLEKPLAAKGGTRSSRWAWLALGASVVLYPLAIVVALGNQQDEWLPNLIATMLALVPPIAGVLLGIRPAKSGNRLAGFATAVGSAWLTLIVTFFVGANYLWSGESLVSPNLLAIILAGIIGGTVEASWYRFWKRQRHPSSD